MHTSQVMFEPHHVVFLRQEFIEEILSPPFGGMIAFVKEAEALMEKGQLDRLKNEEGEKVTGSVMN